MQELADDFSDVWQGKELASIGREKEREYGDDRQGWFLNDTTHANR